MSEYERSWTRAQAIDFLEASRNWSPRDMLVAAAERIEAEFAPSGAAGDRPVAADLGCGGGIETEELLRRGFEVLAIDLHRECLDETRRRAESSGSAANLATRIEDLAALDLRENAFDLVHAGFALPFCPRRAWPRCWRSIARSVRIGGAFVAQFFGPREPMVLEAPPESTTSLDRDGVASLRGAVGGVAWSVVREEEVERPGKGPRGEPKHWHVFHVWWRREG